MKQAMVEKVIDSLSQDCHSPKLRKRLADGITYIAKMQPSTVDKKIFDKFLIPCFTRTVFVAAHVDVPVEEFVDEMVGVFEHSFCGDTNRLKVTFPYQPASWEKDPEAALLAAFVTYFLDNYEKLREPLVFS